MNNTSNITGNIGEWSELYALAFILANGGIYGADKNQARKDTLYYKVLRVILNEQLGKERLSYILSDTDIDIYLGSEKISSLKTTKLQNIIPKMLVNLLQYNDGRAFSLKAGFELMHLLGKDGIKASSYDKKDLDMIILDIKTATPTPEIGFSIKSQLGSPSTLVNASHSTNFTFEILDADGKVPTSLPTLHPKNVKDNVCRLLDSGFELKYSHIDSDIFQYNLSLIDSNLPEYLAILLLAYYGREATFLDELVSLNFPIETLEGKLARHKIKEFLSVMALGMMPNTEWNGILTSLGGLLLVKKDGDVLCYYLYNLDDFQEYLLENTKLETPSTSRYGIGQIIAKEGRFFIKLNLQVRFLK